MSRGQLDGAANSKAGYAWQHSDAVYLRDHGFPLAASARRGVDMVAGPVGIDATILPWDKIPAKLDKAIEDTGLAGLRFAVVWKKRNRRPRTKNSPGDAGSTDPARGFWVMRADHGVALVRALEAAEARADAAEALVERWVSRERVS